MSLVPAVTAGDDKATAPATFGEAFAHINGLTSPAVDDLKVMVLLEAAGLDLYRGMVPDTDNAEVAALLEHNGREEMAHAYPPPFTPAGPVREPVSGVSAS